MRNTDDRHGEANDDATRLAPITGRVVAPVPGEIVASDASGDDATRIYRNPADEGGTHEINAYQVSIDEINTDEIGADEVRTDTIRAEAIRAHAPLDDATVVKPRSPAADDARATSQSTGAGTDWAALSGQVAQVQVGVGSLLKGRFLLEREIGRGGMGVVYLARDERKVEARDRHPHIAVKILNDDFRRHPDALVALQREARKAQRLAHDNIVRVYDFDKDGTIVFMTMEYIDGADLRGLIRSRQGSGMPVAEATGLIEGMGRALLRAHEAGVVHSDFKPGNVMVGADGVAKVFDFGIARATRRVGEGDDDRTVFDATSLGAMTPAYASLEMLRGDQPAIADDVYAFGCVVYELLAGRHPFDKQTAEQARAQALFPKPVRGLSRRQNRALLRCLAFESGDRIGMAAAIEQLRPRSRGEKLRRYAVVTGAVLLVAAIGTLGYQEYSRREQVDRVIERFSPTARNRFVDENQAGKALMALDEDARRRLVVDQSAAIESFLLARIDRYWMPHQARENYLGAQKVLALREQLKLFSPRLETRRIELEQERNRILNDLDTRLSRAIANGALFEDQPGSAVAVLDRIRTIDPNSRLLRHAQLALSYDSAIAQAISQGQLESARAWLATARRVFPADPAWPLREKALAETAALVASMPTGMSMPIAGPTVDATQDPGLTLAQAEPSAEPGATPAAVPAASAAPAVVIAPVQDGAMKDAEIETKIESVRGAAAARDADKVADLLQRIAELNPEHPFPQGEGAQLLRETVLGRARGLFKNGKWTEAAAVANKRDDWNSDPVIRQVGLRYALASDLASYAGAEPPAEDLPRLQARVRKLRVQDGKGMRQLQTEISASGRRGAATVAALLTRLSAGGAVADTQQAPVGDVCRSAAAGTARICSDSLGGYGTGPGMVLIPRPGQKPLAMMRKELSVEDLKPFCAATDACSGSNRWRGKSVVSDIPVSVVQKYAQWLSTVSGRAYRLPSDTEWLTAARAGGGESICELAVANRWGLINMAGGVGEWVVDGSALGVRGGSSRGSACTAAGKSASDGRADNKVGARLVRELK